MKLRSLPLMHARASRKGSQAYLALQFCFKASFSSLDNHLTCRRSNMEAKNVVHKDPIATALNDFVRFGRGHPYPSHLGAFSRARS
eukprot:scaffold58499_cov21-Tisochrysis_lutea.AAC.1